jgi:choline dehydrogenase-like flavoprotein
VVVGSGASGVHFALTLLRRGIPVLMLDVGRRRAPGVLPSESFRGLRSRLDDPAAYFLGRRFEALMLPGAPGEYYGFPPHKQYIFEGTDSFHYDAQGFAPLISFAMGGLAEAWTGGCYPFTEAEVADFPLRHAEFMRYYSEVAARIGIAGVVDDLASFFPVHEGLLEPLELDEHSASLLQTYATRREELKKLRCVMGRSRVATLSRDFRGRPRCTYTGRCLWGCPSGAFYTPSMTLDECRTFPHFEYVEGRYVSHFRFGSDLRIRSVITKRVTDGESEEVPVATLALAAGALCSSHIFLRSVYEDSGELPRLSGLMDNRQVLMPFVNLRLIGRRYRPDTYQYHQLAIGIERDQPLGYVHGLVTTLKTALVHPVVQSIPLDLPSSLKLFRHLHAGLGLVNVNFSDTRRSENYIALERTQSREPLLTIRYEPAVDEAAQIAQTTRLFRKILWKLRCIAPPQMTHVRPMGASVHYAGTIPMSATPRPLTCSPACRSHDFSNLYFVDGATFCALPSKNVTFTLMANAIRVAETLAHTH